MTTECCTAVSRNNAPSWKGDRHGLCFGHDKHKDGRTIMSYITNHYYKSIESTPASGLYMA